jgi:transcriptional regulator with XRE-family HTH domain
MNERLKEIRKSMNMNQTEFSQLLGVGQSTLAMMEVSKRDISDRHVKTICAICRVNEHWLRTGEGEMFVSSGGDFAADMKEQYHLSDYQMALVRAVYEMPPEFQRMAVEFARKVAAESYRNAEIDEETHERIEQVANDYLDAVEAQQPAQQTDKKA